MHINPPENCHAKEKYTRHHPATGAHHRPGAAGAATGFFDGGGARAHHRESGRLAHRMPLPPASGTRRRPARIGCAGAVDWNGGAVNAIAAALSGLFCYGVDSRLRMISGRFGQLRPVFMPIKRTHFLAGNQATTHALDGFAVFSRYGFFATTHL